MIIEEDHPCPNCGFDEFCYNEDATWRLCLDCMLFQSIYDKSRNRQPTELMPFFVGPGISLYH